MGLMPEEYYDMPCSLYAEMSEAYVEKLNREYEVNVSYHVAVRKLAFFTYLPNAEKGFTFSKFTKLWPIPGDEQRHSTESAKISMTKEQIEDAYLQMNKLLQLKRRNKNKK